MRRTPWKPASGFLRLRLFGRPGRFQVDAHPDRGEGRRRGPVPAEHRLDRATDARVLGLRRRGVRRIAPTARGRFGRSTISTGASVQKSGPCAEGVFAMAFGSR